MKKGAVSEPATLEERVEKIEREIKFHWRLLNIFLFLNAIVILEHQIMPLIISLMH